MHIHYQALPVLPVDPVDPIPGEPEEPETPDNDKPTVNTPDKDVNNGSTNSTHRPDLPPFPIADSGSSQNTQSTGGLVRVGESSSPGTDNSGGYLGTYLPQAGWGHVAAGIIITIWCVLFGLAIRENISPDKKREEE